MAKAKVKTTKITIKKNPSVKSKRVKMAKYKSIGKVKLYS